ncbi:hypothetical protein CCR75_004582 [Bremia lactucae]|uniref:Uncharacterized protein n=1 Tax=Bremia lactucae TaxID=4779 RepID=A0A976IEL3_BRELC|nr:hypothetical protein CCR75_004582 [Bremia lactucae]
MPAKATPKMEQIQVRNAKQLSPAFHAKTLHLFADLMFTKLEYKRAIRQKPGYKRAKAEGT